MAGAGWRLPAPGGPAHSPQGVFTLRLYLRPLPPTHVTPSCCPRTELCPGVGGPGPVEAQYVPAILEPEWSDELGCVGNRVEEVVKRDFVVVVFS